MKKQFYIIFLISSIILSGCKKGKEGEIVKPAEIKFSLKGAKAIIYDKNVGSKTTDDASPSGNLFKMDENGKISSAVEGIEVTSFKTLPSGLYVYASSRRFFVKPDNSYVEFKISKNAYDDGFVGCDSLGRLIFSDLSIFDPVTSTVTKIKSSLPAPELTVVSGNFAAITDFEHGHIAQIVNIVTGVRYNIGLCNGPRIFDLGSDKAYVNDCSDKALIDMTTGSRTAMNDNYLVGEAVSISSGHINLSNRLGTGYWELGKIDINGVNSISTETYSVTPSAGTCTTCKNVTLFGDGDNVVVKEFTQVSIFNITSSTRTNILAGYNIISVSIKDNKVYFLAEDNTGNPKSGFYDITTSSFTYSNSSDYYNTIQAF